MKKRSLEGGNGDSESPAGKRVKHSPPDLTLVQPSSIGCVVDVTITNTAHHTNPFVIQACRVEGRLWTFFHWVTRGDLFPLRKIDLGLLRIETVDGLQYSVLCGDTSWDVCVLQPREPMVEAKGPSFAAADGSNPLAALQRVQVAGKSLFHAPRRAGPVVAEAQVIGVDSKHNSYIINVPSTKGACGAPAFLHAKDDGTVAVLHGILSRSVLVEMSSTAHREAVPGGSSLFIPASTFLAAIEQKRLVLPSETRDRSKSVTEQSGDREEGEEESFWSGERPTVEKVAVTMSDGTVHEREVGEAEWSDIA